MKTNEETRLEENASRQKNWERWGPYLSERQWATVREDYSADGGCWDYFPHDHARSRAYRWGEDGLLGITGSIEWSTSPAKATATFHGNDARFAHDPHWRDLVLFHEYFHGDTGRGLGASHQTGWTALSVKLLEHAHEGAPQSRHV